MKLCLDAGHGGSDPGAVYQTRKEKDDVLKLTLAVGKILKQNKLEIVYTRTTDIYNKPYDKVVIANQSNADYFISFHRNSSGKENSAKGVEILVKNKSTTKEMIANNMKTNLGTLGFQYRGLIERNNLVVLNKTTMPALLLEIGFINSNVDNELFDKKFNLIATAIAKGILEALGMKYGSTESEKKYLKTSYQIQIGSFKNTENAKALVKKLLKSDFVATIIKDNNFYRVQIGPYLNLAEVKKVQQKLIKSGFDAFIKT